MRPTNSLDWTALIIALIGGINWGLVGLLGLDIVEAVLGALPVLAQTVYIVVGLAAVYVLVRAVMPARAGPSSRGQPM